MNEAISEGALAKGKDGQGGNGNSGGQGPGPGGGPGGDNGSGNNTVTVTIDGVRKSIHRGSYTTPDLKQALGVAPGRELNLIVDNVFQPIAEDARTTVREGMEFVSQQPGGGAS
jgi:hypothetical protein